MLLTGLSDAAAAALAAMRVLGEFREPFSISKLEIFMTASIGISISAAGSTPDELLRDADTALYRAKIEGKARYVMFDEGMKTQVSNKLRLESDLRRSLDAGELTLHYQPEVDIKTGRILGFEALARWPQADGSFIEPAEFIPIAEETGLIVPLGAWVLETACRQMAAWRTSDRRLRHLVMGVNVSPRQLQDSDQLVEQIRRNLRRSRLRPSALRIELTESTILGDDPQMAERLHRLKELGVGVAIDDFGTGYSSLTYLTRLAPDCIKIDRSFVSDIDTHEDKAAIVGALLSLGQRLGIDVTAEGVETKAEARLLESLGCTRAQGYLFYRPLEAEAAEACLLAGLSR